MKIVEQVDVDGNIVMDYDTSLSKRKLFEKLCETFPNIHEDEEGLICGEYNGHRFAVRMKNITYLGHPHPLYKKRIQIAKDLQDFYRSALEKGRTPILLGVYTYQENTLFCEFNIEDYVGKKAHNSSAHVYTENLADAAENGFFQKEDYFGNRITIFTPKTVNVFLEEKFAETVEASAEYRHGESAGHSIVADSAGTKPKFAMPQDIQNAIVTFFNSERKHWDGIECYKKMIASNYRNKYQPEWPGFFLEYEFETFLNEHKLTNLITYAQDKTKGGIDLDLFFPTIDMYGDLKAHSSNSKGIQGNDWGTVFSLIDDPNRDNHIFYVVCEHDTFKDSDYDYVVTQFWNSVQKKENLMSYAKRMKNNIELKRSYILDINASNKMHLSKFKQGINSNGKPRAPKIMIDHDMLSEFIIEEQRF